MTIPKQIHQIWLGRTVPDQVQLWHNGWQELHPSWEVHLWRDSDLESFVSLPQFQWATVPAVKADIARAEILQRLGGVYVDADIECHHDIAALIAGVDRVFLSEGPYVCNGFGAFIPEDPFTTSLVKHIGTLTRDEIRRSEFQPLWLTGPLLWTSLLAESGLSISVSTRVLAPDYFFVPKTRNETILRLAAIRRFGTHHAMATWRSNRDFYSLLRRTRLLTRIRRFLDLSAS